MRFFNKMLQVTGLMEREELRAGTGISIKTQGVISKLLPFSTAVFLGFLAIGIPLPVLPLQVHDSLGFGTVTVGIAIGIQSLATLLTRQYAGKLCDRWGSKPTALLGFGCAGFAGLFYIASDFLPSHALALAVLIGGRLVLGFGESLFITATAAWSIARVGPGHAGRAMAWQGLAMYAAMSFGAAFGNLIEGIAGFRAIAVLVMVFPAFGALLVLTLPAIAAVAGPRLSFLRVLRAIWVPGLALSLATAGFGTIAAFIALRFQAAGWSNPGLALLGFGIGYIAMRLLFGGLPDRIGGVRVALCCLTAQVFAQILIWGAWSPIVAIIGVTLAGTAYSLVFPSLGVEAMRLVAPQDRALAIGAFLGCFDLGLGAAGPIAGLVAARFGLPAAFLAAAGSAVISMVLIVGSKSRK